LNSNHNNNKCNKCNLTIHSNFIGYHKCGYANCPVCKNAITNSQYQYHIRSHLEYENGIFPLTREKSDSKGAEYKNYSRGGHSGAASICLDSVTSQSKEPVQAGKEYEFDISEISRQGDGVARVQGFVVFINMEKQDRQLRLRSIKWETDMLQQ
jgi:predicted RNA-binding protein with TRAM domain